MVGNASKLSGAACCTSTVRPPKSLQAPRGGLLHLYCEAVWRCAARCCAVLCGGEAGRREGGWKGRGREAVSSKAKNLHLVCEEKVLRVDELCPHNIKMRFRRFKHELHKVKMKSRKPQTRVPEVCRMLFPYPNASFSVFQSHDRSMGR